MDQRYTYLRHKSGRLCVMAKCRTGSYSIRSRFTDEGVKRFWKSIWHLKVPNKVKVFLWRACLSALPTKVGLHKRNIIDNKICD